MPQSEIQPTRFQRRLLRVFGLEGPSPAPIMDADVQPVVQLETDRPVERFNQGEKRFGGSISLAGVALEYDYAFLINPADSGIIACVEAFAVGSNAAVLWYFGDYNPTYVASLAGRVYDALDQRIAQNALGHPGTCDLLVGSDPANGGVLNAVGSLTAPANEMFKLQFNYVLPPGTGFAVRGNSLNVPAYGYIHWFEREVLIGELTGTR